MFESDSLGKKFWYLLVSLTTVGTILLIPLSLVYSPLSKSTGQIIGILISFIYLLDILGEFNTAYFSEGKMVEDRKKIAVSYISRTFFIDLIAMFPGLYLFYAGVLPGTHIIRLLPILHLVKLLKFGRMVRTIGGDQANPAILRLLLLVFWILSAAHIIACAWIIVSGNPDNLAPVDRYVTSFYWTITTLTTIGFGDITPTGTNQTLFVIVIEIIGAAMYGLVIGNIAGLLANIDVAKTQYREKLDRVNAFMKNRGIPADLKKKIGNYYSYLWETRRGYDEVTILRELPAALKESVALHLNKEIIEKVPLFEKAGDALIRDIILNLRPIIFTPDDYIVRAGEIGEEMFFISRGAVDVLSADEETKFAELQTGMFFGEISLLLSMPRTATIKAIEYCDLYCLNKVTFDRVIQRYPLFQESMETLAKKRKREIESLRKQRDPGDGGTKPSKKDRRVTAVNADMVENGIMLTWQALENASGYSVLKKHPPGNTWKTAAENLPRPVWTDESPETTNSYRIKARFHDEEGPWSKVFTVQAKSRQGQ